jgi:hypothetical protein
MGCSASNAATDLADRARRQAGVREQLARKLFEDQGLTSEEVDRKLSEARAVLRVHRHDNSPDAEQYGSPVPALYNGEAYETAEVATLSGGDRLHTLVRPVGGGRSEVVKVRMVREGGEFTRVAVR